MTDGKGLLGKSGETWPLRLYLSCATLMLSSFLSGWHTSVLNSTIADSDMTGSLLRDMNLTTQAQELGTALVIVGAAIGATLSVIPSTIGCRRTLLLTNLFFLAGTVLTAVGSIPLFMVGRFLVGLACGVVGISAPVLLTETAPTAIRGRVAALHQLGVTLGILFSGALGYVFVNDVAHGWRVLFLAGAVPAVLQLIAMALVPESPRWLLRQQRSADAQRELAAMRPDGADVTAELRAMRADAEREAALQEDVTWATLWSPRYRRAFLVGVVLMVLLAITGINTVVFFSSSLFRFAGVADPLFASVLLFAANVLVTVLVTVLIERVGRRLLLLSGNVAMTAALVSLGVTLLLPKTDAQGIVAVACLLVFMSGFAIGYGGVGFVLLGELVPTAIRGKTFALATAFNWAFNCLLSLSTLSAVEALGGGSDMDSKKHGVAILYLGFAVVSVAAFAFSFTFVRETRGKSLEELDAENEEDVLSADGTAILHPSERRSSGSDEDAYNSQSRGLVSRGSAEHLQGML